MASSPHQAHFTRQRQVRACSPDDAIVGRDRGSRRRRAESPPAAGARATSSAAHAHYGQPLRYLTQLSGQRWHSCELPVTWQLHHAEYPRGTRRDSYVDELNIGQQQELSLDDHPAEGDRQPYAFVLRNATAHGVESTYGRRRGSSSSSCGSPTSRPTLVLAIRSDNLPQLKIRTARKAQSSKGHGRRTGHSESGTTSAETTPSHKGASVRSNGCATDPQGRPGPSQADIAPAAAHIGSMHLRRRLFRHHSSQTEEDVFTETDSAQGDWCDARHIRSSSAEQRRARESPPLVRRQRAFQYPCPCRRSQEAQYQQYQHEYRLQQQQRWSDQTSDVDSSFVSLGAQSGEASSSFGAGEDRRRTSGHSPRRGRSPRHKGNPRPSPTSPREKHRPVKQVQDTAEGRGSTSTCAGRDTGYSEASSSSAEDSSSARQQRSSSSGALASASEEEGDEEDSSTDGQGTWNDVSESEGPGSEPRQKPFAWPPTSVQQLPQQARTSHQRRATHVHGEPPYEARRKNGIGGSSSVASAVFLEVNKVKGPSEGRTAGAPDEEPSERQDTSTSSVTEEEEDEASEQWPAGGPGEEASRDVSRDDGKEDEEEDASTATNRSGASCGKSTKQTAPQFLRPTIEIDRSDILHTAKPEIDEGDFDVGPTYQKMSEAEFVARLSIHEAARTGDLHVIKLLLRSDPKRMETVDERGWTPILLAAANGHSEVVRYLAIEGADVAALDPTSYTAMHLAAMNGHNACLEVLLKVGADVDNVTADGFTPLHLAALNNYADCVQTLLSWGANLGLEDALGRTVQDMVEEYGLDDVSALLSSLWAEIDKCRDSGKLNGQSGSSRKKSTRKLIQMAAAALGRK